MDQSLRWYIAAGRVTDALQFATSMSPFWLTEGRIGAGRRLLAAVLALRDSAAQHRARAQAWYDAGLLAFRQRDQDASRNANERSLRMATEVGDTTAMAHALVGLSRVELRAHAYDSVRTHAAEAAALLTSAGDARAAIGPSHMIAAVNRMTGRDNEADSLYQRTLARFRSESNGPGIAGELMNLGYVRLHQGRRAQAVALFRDALSRFETGAGVTLDPDDQYELDRYSAKAQKQLGDPPYARAVAEGARLTLAQALKLVPAM